MKKKNLLPLRLQFFAESTDEEGNDVNNGISKEEDDNNDDDGAEDEKKFTQKELNKLLAKEKRDGRKSVLNSLGFKTEEEAKSAFDLLKALTDTQKTNEQKMKEDKEKVTKTLEGEKERADNAEAKLSCLMNGVNKDSIDDVLAIAMSKVDDDNSLDDVIKGMKKNGRYSLFFEDSSKGTGTPPGHGGKGSSKDNYGERIALNNKTEKVEKSFFD